jgi:hypothetical protein
MGTLGIHDSMGNGIQEIEIVMKGIYLALFYVP